MSRNQKPRVEGEHKQLQYKTAKLHANFVKNKDYKGLTDFIDKLDLSKKTNYEYAFENVFKVIDPKVFDKVVREIRKRNDFEDFAVEVLESPLEEGDENMIEYFKKKYLKEILETKGTWIENDNGDKIYFYDYYTGQPMLYSDPEFAKLVDLKVAETFIDGDQNLWLIAQNSGNKMLVFRVRHAEDEDSE